MVSLLHHARVPTVLVVDDDAATINRLRYVIETGLSPVRVLVAPSTEGAAIAMATSPIDALVANYDMPGMDALEVILRNRYPKNPLPAFFITGHPDVRAAAAAMNRTHVTGYFAQPIDEDQFRRNLERVLQPKRYAWSPSAPVPTP